MMALKIIKRIALSLTFVAMGLTFVSLNGCYYDNRDDLEPFLGGISCDTTAVSYLNDILPVLEAQCISCHSASNASGGINLEGFSKVKTQAGNGKLMGSITYSSGYSPMPPGGAKLPACEISRIESWINTGTPDN